MIALVRESLTHALMITGFVFVMMLVIEYLNVLTSGVWQQGLRGSRWKQYLLASCLGATPGCLGAFAVVSLYSHQVVSLGAVVAAMVATSGDESFVMLSMIPRTAIRIFLLLMLIGAAAGILTDWLVSARTTGEHVAGHQFPLHEEDACHCFPSGQILNQWRHCTLARGVLILTLLLFDFGLLSGQLGPPVWNWIKTTLLITANLGLFIVATVPDHFLEEHLWQHVAIVHVPRVFLWTFGALLGMHLLIDHLHLAGWMQENQLLLVLAACLVGLVPESGPHLIFLTLYSQGAIPFSILLANSIVQDGHGMLPLLAHSRLDFFRIKGINCLIGFLVGLIGYAIGW
ncbi:MAG: arsenic efflux protein [Deltaproteobacteria bacterium]|nr:arsenic efflux protein [Candidatus Anaeroferrophillus wilburensis]MBN2888265.1 arsenic efflux protein [Deltaproteobacteria bacterium]